MLGKLGRKSHEKRILGVVLFLGAMGICLCGCVTGSSSKENETNYTEGTMKNALDTVGLPNISNYYERSQLKSIYELRDNPDLICYWYTKNDMSGKWVYEGTCMGYGIPYGASMTNSSQVERNSSGTSTTSTIDLAEPNGLYTNNVTSSATWILTITENGGIEPQYVEQEIRVSQTKIKSERCEEWSMPSDY